MAREYYNENSPLLGNNEALQREARKRKTKQLITVIALVFVVAMTTMAIAIPVHYVRKTGRQNNMGNDNLVDINGTDVMYMEFVDFADRLLCPSPVSPTNYKEEELKGLWYVVAKIQTQGAAVLQEGCRCSTMDFALETAGPEDALMTLRCRDDRMAGAEMGAIVPMKTQMVPGYWIQNLYGTQINWYITSQRESVFVAYDCSLNYENTLEYGLHFFSRSQQVDRDEIVSLLDSVSYLNVFDSNLVWIDQENCSQSETEEIVDGLPYIRLY